MDDPNEEETNPEGEIRDIRRNLARYQETQKTPFTGQITSTPIKNVKLKISLYEGKTIPELT